MKFLCVRCDEAMKLERVEEPEGGSLSVVFTCTACGNRMAMLTNPWETQLVRALDVRIGGRSSPAEPMEFVRGMLASRREAGLDAANTSGAATGTAPASRCPFSAMANLAVQGPGADGEPGNQAIRKLGNQADPEGTRHSGKWAIGKSGASEQVPGAHLEIEEPGTPSCPVAEPPNSQIAWSPDAERRLERIPGFIRPMIRQGIEQYAAQRGYQQITEDVMAEARGRLGM